MPSPSLRAALRRWRPRAPAARLAVAGTADREGGRSLADVLLGLLLATVVLSPLPLGSVEPLAWGAIAIAVSLATLASGALLLRSRALQESFAPTAAGLAAPLALFAAVMAWGLAQSVLPVPSGLAHPIWEMAGAALGRPLSGRISVAPDAVWPALVRDASYAATVLSAALLCRDRRRARAALFTIALAGGAYALYGIAAEFSATPSILWWKKWAYQGDVTGTFVNRNNFASFAGLGLVAAAAALHGELQGVPAAATLGANVARLVERALRPRGGLLLAAAASTAAALLLSHSRGGAGSTLAALAALLGLSAMRQGRAGDRRLAYAGLALFAIVLLPFVFISGAALLSRYGATVVEDDQRAHVFALVWQAIRDAPLTGFGLGSFAAAFPLYRDAQIVVPYDAAHSDVLQAFFELGLPGGAALLTAIAWPALLCLRGGLTRGRDWHLPLLGFAASLLVGLHSLVDFGLQIPAVALTYSFLLGLGLAQCRSSRPPR